jgi:hypothetical protein
MRGQVVPAATYSSEEELERLLERWWDLLRDDKGPAIAFVDRQVNLPDGAGKLDLLFVDSNGLPIVVEVKLIKNGESRREVVGQVLDYLSSLTALTVDELNNLVDGKLETALRNLTKDPGEPEEKSGEPEDDPDDVGEDAGDAEGDAGDAEEGADDAEEGAGGQKFRRVWRAVGTNLRAGQAKLVVALDEAPPSLEKIFRFLARNSRLNVQLLTMKKYSSPEGEEAYVPRTVVNPEGAVTPPPNRDLQFEAIIDAYNSIVAADAPATGDWKVKRNVLIPGWPPEIHYRLRKEPKNCIAVRLTNKSRDQWWGSLEDCLAAFIGTVIAGSQGPIQWKSQPNEEKLMVDFLATTQPEVIARGIHEFVSKTRPIVTEGPEKRRPGHAQ